MTVYTEIAAEKLSYLRQLTRIHMEMDKKQLMNIKSIQFC